MEIGMGRRKKSKRDRDAPPPNCKKQWVWEKYLKECGMPQNPNSWAAKKPKRKGKKKAS